MLDLLTIVLVVVISLGFMLIFQARHYDFLEAKRENEDLVKCSARIDEVVKRLKEFDEYKKKVDALTLKSGFKL